MKEEYSQALPGPDQPVEFESDEIKLDIPEDGISLQGGWMITPLASPVVSVYQKWISLTLCLPILCDWLYVACVHIYSYIT